MHILSVKDPAFRKYGRVITNVDFTQLVEEMKKTPVPDGVVYEPGINALEALPVKKELETITYGEMPVQIGYCNGHNSKLNAVEYHRSSEINVAATDAILILGLLADVAEDFTYDTSKMEEFLVILRKDLCENSFDNFSDIKKITLVMPNRVIYTDLNGRKNII